MERVHNTAMPNLATVNDELAAAFGQIQDDIDLGYELDAPPTLPACILPTFDFVVPPRRTWRDDFRRVLWCAA